MIILHTSIILLKLNLITIRILVRVLVQQNVAVIMIMQLVIRMQLVQYSLQAYFACTLKYLISDESKT